MPQFQRGDFTPNSRREFREKRRRFNWLYSPVVLVGLSVCAFFLGRAVWGLYGKDQDTAIRAASARQQVADLTAQQSALAADVTHLGTPEGVDEQIRATYNVIKPGENLIVLVGSTTADSATETPSMGATGSAGGGTWWASLGAALKSWF
jgi:cell division protein FtsB